MPKSPGQMLDTIARNLKERTGRGVEEWARVLKKNGPSVRKQQVEWLMKEHGLGRVAANLVVSQLEGGPDYSDAAGLIDAQFAGPKAALRPLYQRVEAAARALGPDVELTVGRTQVTFRRRRQFAWVKASTAARLDLGLALPGIEPGGRLRPVSGTNEQDRVRVRIALGPGDTVDAEVQRWLESAYELDAS